MINIILYIAIVVLAEYTATWFISFPVFGMVSFATLLFGATFTLRDRVHSRFGVNVVYAMIMVTALLVTLETLFLGVSYRIIIASILAISLSEFTDTQIYQRFVSSAWFSRVLRSNSVSIPLDSTIFNLISFYGIFGNFMLLQLTVGQIIIKFLIGAIVALKKGYCDEN